MAQSQYDPFGMNQPQYGLYGEEILPQQDQYGFNSGFEVPDATRDAFGGSLDFGSGNGNIALPPQPSVLHIQAQLDGNGNWFYPSVDQSNHDLRIQCEAFRAGAASRSGIPLPIRSAQNSRPPVSPMAPPRKKLKPVSRRFSRPVKPKATPGRKKRTSVAQICVCHEATFTPKRPPNAFMMFRTKFQPRLVKAIEDDPSLRGRTKNGSLASLQASVSSLASQWWNEAKTTGEDQVYWQLAEAEKAAHAARNPGYKYQSGKKYQLNWGDETCRCGAFQANEAKKREREAERLGHDPDDGSYNYEDEYEDEEEGDAPYASPTLHRAPKRPGSRTSLGGPPAKRRAGSIIANTTGYSGGVENNAIFPTDNYVDPFADFGYGGGMDDNTILYNTPPSGNVFQPQMTQPLYTQSNDAGISPTGRRRSRPSTTGFNNSFSTSPRGGQATEQDFRNASLGRMGSTTGGGSYNTGPSTLSQTLDAANEQRNQERRASYDSLFDMDAFATPRSSGRNSRAGPSPSGSRRSTRRSEA